MINEKILQIIKEEFQNSYNVKACEYPVNNIAAEEKDGYLEISVNDRELVFESEFAFGSEMGYAPYICEIVNQGSEEQTFDIDCLADDLNDAVCLTYKRLLQEMLPELKASILNVLPELTEDDIFADEHFLTIDVGQFILDINIVDCTIHRISLTTDDIDKELAQKKSEPIIKIVKECFNEYCQENL